MTRVLWSVCPDHLPHAMIRAATGANVEQVLEAFSSPFMAKKPRGSLGRGFA